MKIEINVGKIKVNQSSKKSGYYSFEWDAVVNGKKKKGAYDSSYSGQSSNAIRGKLKRGYAIQLAIEQLFGF